MKQRYVTAIGALLLLGSSHAQADTRTVSIPASRDATIFADKFLEDDDVLNSANGRGPALYSGVDAAGGIKRGLIKFDVWRHVPSDAVVTDVKLILTLSRVADAATGGRAIDLRKVMSSWGEGPSRSESEHGSPAEDGDVTWYYQRYQDFDQRWSDAGGNYDYPDRDEPTASATIANPVVGERVVWSSAEMIYDVEEWIVDREHNYGWGLLNDPEHMLEENESTPPPEGRNYAYLAFWSRDSSGASGPVLEVTYECTAPDCEQ